MARLARVVAPGEPHHVVQRGNRRQKTFFCEGDYKAYLELMAQWCDKHKVEIWSYCLMPNHIHMIAVPQNEEGFCLAIGEAHRRYTRRVNFRKGWRGHLWQGRFSSFVLDEPHLLCAARYIEMNPVKAGLVERPEDWQWSSASAHLAREDDSLVKAQPLLEIVGGHWRRFLSQSIDEEEINLLCRHERTGRPLGSDSFVKRLERRLGRTLLPKKPGRKPKESKK